jgi:hypothetical protein
MSSEFFGQTKTVRKTQVGGWRWTGSCPNGHRQQLFITLPDFGDAPSLFQCVGCSDLFSIDRDAEIYIGPIWDDFRSNVACPSCGESLVNSWLYPDHFRCLECNAIGLEADRPEKYPPESDRVIIECWDPYRDSTSEN